MEISLQELEKIEYLLDSPDKKNIELGLTILSGFAVESSGINWLWGYYLKLKKKDELQKSKYNLDAFLYGSARTNPSKSSRILMLLLEKAPPPKRLEILSTFVQEKTLTLPRIEMTDFPDIISQFTELERIIWQYGNLTRINDLSALPNLKYLDVRHQPIIEIDEKITEHPSLMELWINNALIVTESIAENAKFDILIEAAY